MEALDDGEPPTLEAISAELKAELKTAEANNVRNIVWSGKITSGEHLNDNDGPER